MTILMAGIFVHDPIAAFMFYTEVLGFEKKVFVPEARLAVVAAAGQPDGASLLLGPNDTPVGKTYQRGLYEMGLPAIVFGTKDIQADYERLKAKGVIFKSEPVKTQWGIQAVLDDTCGNYVQLHQLPE